MFCEYGPCFFYLLKASSCFEICLIFMCWMSRGSLYFSFWAPGLGPRPGKSLSWPPPLGQGCPGPGTPLLPFHAPRGPHCSGSTDQSLNGCSNSCCCRCGIICVCNRPTNHQQVGAVCNCFLGTSGSSLIVTLSAS